MRFICMQKTGQEVLHKSKKKRKGKKIAMILQSGYMKQLEHF